MTICYFPLASSFTIHQIRQSCKLSLISWKFKLVKTISLLVMQLIRQDNKLEVWLKEEIEEASGNKIIIILIINK